MCGIAGISTSILKDRGYWERWARIFSNSIEERGKDDSGLLFLNRNADPTPVLWGKEGYETSLQYLPKRNFYDVVSESVNGFLLHQRLSIIAPGERGHQPMCDASSRYWLTYNGEIFNYIELRKQYKLNTVTDTDTEVLLELWAKMEEKCLPLLDGFFAFCIYDSQENNYTIVRDKTGVKPLNYVLNKEGFAFSSNEEALREFSGSSVLNKQAIYLHMKYGMSDVHDWYEGVKTLPAGHWLKWIPNLRNTIFRRWYFPSSHYRNTEARDLREMLFESMRKRLRSDVPIGFAVSGGIDSAILLGLGRWILGVDEKVHLFSVGSNGKAGDETMWQEQVHRKHGGNMHRIDVEGLTTADLEEQIIKTKRPQVAWNNVAHFALCRRVKDEGVVVLFNGQGADEIFGGYPDYFIQGLKDEGASISKFKEFWPIPASKARQVYLKRKLRSKMSTNLKKKIDKWAWSEVFPTEIINDNNIELHPTVENVQEMMLGDYYGKLQDPKFYGKLYQMLAWEDRNGMAFQLESRNPFADDLNIPKYFLGKKTLSELSQNGLPKGLLRNTFKDLLPQDLYNRTDKKGFTMPDAWLTHEHGTEWTDWIMNTNLDDIISRSYREKLVSNFEKLNVNQYQNYFRIATLGRFLDELK